MSISPEFREIGKFTGRKPVFSPEKSNFSQTCNLLSQYLKENGSFGDLSFAPVSGKTSSAMDLFPQNTGFGSRNENSTDLSEMKQMKKPKSKQMTIMYAGKVLVFDDISEEKVKELLMLANNNGGLVTQNNKFDLNSANKSAAPGEERVQVQPAASVLPHARKASLHRFLEKRKDRIAARAPYQVNNTTTSSKEEESKAWLGLASPCSSGL